MDKKSFHRANTPTCRLILAGDVMTGRGIDQILPHPGNDKIYEAYMHSAAGYVHLAEARNGPIPPPVDFSYPWGDARALIAQRNPNCRIVNLETAITRCDAHWPGKGINYRMHPANTPCLTAAEIDLCVLANNHILDWGYPGLSETLQTLSDNALLTCGAGESKEAAEAPAILDCGETRLVVVACGHSSSGIPEKWAATDSRAGVNLLADLSVISAERLMRRVQGQHTPQDLLLVSVHWGGNWGYRVANSQRKFAHRLIELGADLVHGHSSHHPMGIEVYRERPILYGCGDLINDYEGISGHEEYRSELRLLYCVDLDSRTGQLRMLELIPLESYRFRLRHTSSANRSWLRQTLARECQTLGTDLECSGDQGSFLLKWNSGENAGSN